MHKTLTALALLAAAPLGAEDKPAAPLAPSEIVAAAPKADWSAIAATDLLVMDLSPDAKGKPRRVVIQLMPPPFSQGWIGNIRKLAAARFWDGLSVNRVQDNYVVQWGDADGEDKAKARKLPDGLVTVPESEYVVALDSLPMSFFKESCIEFNTRFSEDRKVITMMPRGSVKKDLDLMRGCQSDPYSRKATNAKGMPFALGPAAIPDPQEIFGPSADVTWPVHCYGMVGVGRNLSPDTGSGAELYTVIGHAPRHLDRNIAVVGRVIEGIEHLSSLPRGTEALGFYKTAEERVPIQSVRLGNEVAGLPAYEYLSTESESFARYADARANRRDAFFIRPAGGADVCNIPVPVRRVK